eukprot:sb/3479615/
MENEIFNELFNTFLSPASTIEDCLKSVNWLTSDNSSSLTMNGDHRQPEAATTRVKVEQYDDTTIGTIDQDDDDDDDDQIMMPVAKRHRVHSGYQSIDDPLENSMLSSDNSPSKRYDISLLECLTKSEERAIKKARRKIKTRYQLRRVVARRRSTSKGWRGGSLCFPPIRTRAGYRSRKLTGKCRRKSYLHQRGEQNQLDHHHQYSVVLLSGLARTVQQKPVARPPPVQCCTVATQTESIGQQLRGSRI